MQLFYLILLFLSVPAYANGYLAANSCERMGDLIASNVIDTGAACANSFRGQAVKANQTIRNMEQFKSPAETKAEDACPLVLGGSALALGHDPVFKGRAGHKGAYFKMDGSACFGDPAAAPAFPNTWGKTTGRKDFTIAVSFRFVHTGTSQSLVATTYGNSKGILFFITATDHLAFEQQGDTGLMTQATASATLVDGTDYVAAASYNGTTLKLFTGSSTPQSFTRTFNATSSDPGGRLAVGCTSDGSSFLANQTRVYDPLEAFDTALDNTAMATLISKLEARNGIDLTP